MSTELRLIGGTARNLRVGALPVLQVGHVPLEGRALEDRRDVPSGGRLLRPGARSVYMTRHDATRHDTTHVYATRRDTDADATTTVSPASPRAPDVEAEEEGPERREERRAHDLYVVDMLLC